jgi:hypothetical protein
MIVRPMPEALLVEASCERREQAHVRAQGLRESDEVRGH